MIQLTPIAEAAAKVLAAVRVQPTEHVPLASALGRTAATDIVSRDNVPGFANSAMDGFALRGADVDRAREGLRVVVDIPAGTTQQRTIGPGEAARIMTGAPLPEGADTVVPVEATEVSGDVVRIVQPVRAGQDVRPAGEDVRAGDVVVRAGRCLVAADLGLLAASGVVSVPVARRPRVAILATGSELVAPDEAVGPGLIRNSNSFTAMGQTLEAGAEPVMLGVAPDDPEITRQLLQTALEEDVVLTTGGVSVGDYDFVKSVQEELGVQRRFWRVLVKPGKPLAFGVRGATLVFGVPGNPVSSMTSFELFVRPALLSMLGRRDVWRPWTTAVAAEPVGPTKTRPELQRCRLLGSGRDVRFSLTGAHGSGVLSSMAYADGLLLLPSGFPGAPAGSELPVMRLEGSAEERPPFPV